MAEPGTRKGGRRRAALLALALALPGPAAPQEPGKARERPRAEDDVILFALRLGDVELADSFPARAQGDGYLLPFGELCQELDLAIQVDPGGTSASGFLITENRPFRLDARAGTVTVAGQTRALDPKLMAVRDGDLYLDTRLLAQCLPLEFQVAPRSSLITLVPREPLPLQERWAREGRSGRLRGAAAPEAFEPWPDPYRLLDLPAVDLTLGHTWGGGRRAFTQGTVAAAGDVLWMSTNAYALFNDPGGLRQFRLTMGRKDPHGGMLGPLNATEFGFGEVLDPGMPLVAAPWSGTGMVLSNRPPQLGNAFDRHSFQGPLAPGWQVELYQNEALVAFQASRPDGQYQFLNMPLYFGINRFRLVFYGPQGQRQEERLRFDVSQNQTPAGAFYFHLVGLEPHTDVGRRAQFEATYGLSEQLTATFGTARVTLDGLVHEYHEVGLQGFWKPISGSLLAGNDTRGGSVAELALRKALGSASAVLKETRFRDGFVSEVFQSPLGPLARRSSLEFSAALPTLQAPLLNVDLSGFRDEGAKGGTADTFNARLSTSTQGYFLSNQLSRTLVRAPGLAAATTYSGNILASKTFRGFAVRGQATYNLTGARTLQTLGVTADLFRWSPLSVQGGYTRAVATRENAVNLGLLQGQGHVSFGANFTYSNLTRLSANLTLRMGLFVEPRGHQAVTTGMGVAGTGAVAAEVFVDANGNGRRDPGEKPLADVAMTVNGARQEQVTDAQGRVFLLNQAQQVDAQIAIAPATLEDPLMRGARPGSQITPRNGHVTRLEVPVVMVSEISGTAWLQGPGGRKELAGLRLELVDGAGKVTKSLRTAHDGFYEISNLAPGAYQLRVAPSSATALGAVLPPPRALQLAPEGSMLEGVDFLLVPAP